MPSHYLARIAEPEGRIYFAREHVSAWPAWMQGALASAQGIVAEIEG